MKKNLEILEIVKEKVDMKKIGKQNRASGQRFELRVRKDLEEKGWIVSKWMNNVDLSDYKIDEEGEDKFGKYDGCSPGKLIPAKHKFRGPGIPMAIGTGFPDFICYHELTMLKPTKIGNEIMRHYSIIGCEVKSNGYLTKEEKAKVKWLLENNIFSKILIAKKGKKRGEIEYV